VRVDPASVPLRARRLLRRVLLGGVAGIAWLALSATAASADDAATSPAPAADGTVTSIIIVPLEPDPAEEIRSRQSGEDDLLGDLAQGLLFLQRGAARIRGESLLDDLDTHNFRSFRSPARKRDTRPGS